MAERVVHRSPAAACPLLRRAIRAVRAFLLAAAATAALPALSAAHALDPVLFELRERADGVVDVTWKAPTARVPGLDVQPLLPSECRRTSETEIEDEGDAMTSRWQMTCDGGLAGRTVGVKGLESTDALLRVTLAGGAVDRRVLGASHPTVTIAAAPSKLDVVHDYARLGVEHIAGGIDHLLFVFGLLLLAGGTRLLLATITAFTVGHSVTLALASLEIVSVPQAPVEVVIAVTIYVLAIELARDAAAPPTILRRRPWAMAFAFGLLHGLGFAGALRETGLPSGEVPLALLSFNVGIELGQIAFVGAVLAAAAALRGQVAGLPQWTRRVPVYAMGILSCFWILTRAEALM